MANNFDWVTDKGANNVIVGEPALQTRLNVVFHGSNARLKIGRNVEFLVCNLYLHDNAVLEIGDDSRIRGSFLVHNGCTVKIGASMRCNSYLNISTAERTSVTIGEDCLVAEATIRTSDMHPIFDLETGQRINPSANVVIGDHVWLGQSAFVGKGVVIGSGSVVGAHGVVTKDVPADSVCAGNPARVVRSKIRWEKKL
jgi:acetyltransferase-like isoleucine patch superfamily enzyme